DAPDDGDEDRGRRHHRQALAGAAAKRGNVGRRHPEHLRQHPGADGEIVAAHAEHDRRGQHRFPEYSSTISSSLGFAAFGGSRSGGQGNLRFSRPRAKLRSRGRSFVMFGLQTTRCRCEPRMSPSSSTTSPRLRNCGGFMPRPTPWGVPVMTTSPGSRVMNWLTWETSLATGKIMSLVLLFCRTAPLTARLSGIACGFGISSAVTNHGPSGPKVSKLLPLPHWPPRLACQSRSETSLARQ